MSADQLVSPAATIDTSALAHNPLWHSTGMPSFNSIRPEHVEPAVEAILALNRTRLDQLLAAGAEAGYRWDNLVAPIEEMLDRLDKLWSPVSHLNGVMNSPELRSVYNACLPKLSAFYTDFNQNEALYRAYQALAEGDEYHTYSGSQRKVIDNALRDFRLSGVALPPAAKARYKALMQELSTLQSTFQENLLDATQAWKKQITDPELLAGLPQSALEMMAANAQREELEGYLLNLEFPCYVPVMNYADDRGLRQEMYHAFVTRASEIGPHGGTWDNSALMAKILGCRHEVATLLAFDHYADYSLATKMAETPAQVEAFLLELAHKARLQAEEELAAIRQYAREHDGLETLEAWDVAYYAEKLRVYRYQLSQEELRPYFPEPQVVTGLFAVIERLFKVVIEEVQEVEVWHPDVRCYQIRDGQEVRGRFYLDLYARPNKRSGAWMDGCVTRRRTASGVQLPVAYLVCNFTPPVNGEPALFTHSEVETLFHEFGHGLHHLLTRVDYAPVAGICGVEWDAVELPSQFLENWCWEREALNLLARHYKTGEPLPETLFQRMMAAKNFQSAMMMVRQIEFALFDLRLHRDYDPARCDERGEWIAAVLEQVRQEVAVVFPPAFNRFPHAFTHIFAGGYAAGYYSYKWAEVLAADAFGRFEEEGVFNAEVGEQFCRSVLEQGGARDALTNFREFRGREPSPDALLRQSGIAA